LFLRNTWVWREHWKDSIERTAFGRTALEG
jgi:hypothetical protein